MFTSPTPDHPNPAPGLDPGLALRLPADAYYHLIRTLCLALPPPPGDSPDDLARRNHAAIARIAALAPANAAEADFAALLVAASEQWKDCLRLVQLPETTPEMAMKCRAQAISMMRQEQSALRLLLKLQDARGKREAKGAGDRAAWTEHCAIALMAEALSAQPPPAAPTAPAEPPEPETAAQPAPAPLSGVEATRRLAETDPVLVAGAERYAALYPERAAQIRRTGKLPPDVRHFDPPEAALASALIAGNTPALAALDRDFATAQAG